MNAAIVLSDLLMDFAVVAASDAGAKGVSARDAHAIRTNAPDRRDSGALAESQALVQLFDWFPQCSTLRKMRTAHASPAGSRQPIRINIDDGQYARRLLTDIVRGWIESMAKYPR